MKRSLLTLIGLTAIFLTVFAPSTIAADQDNQKLKNVVLEKTEVVNKDYFAVGDNLTISGTINGDAYLAGGNILFDGIVNGDLLVAGGQVNIRGKVLNNVRLVGGQITIAGLIGRNLSLAGGTVNIVDTAKIIGSLVAGGGNISLFGPIGRNATIGAGQLTLGSTIAGDLNTTYGELTTTQGAKVFGKTSEQKYSRPDVKIDRQRFGRIGLGLKLMGALGMLIVGLLLLKLFPNFMSEMNTVISKKFWRSLGIGFVTLILLPLAFVILLLTVVGIPLAFILLAFFMIVSYLAKIFSAAAFGRIILKIFTDKEHWYWSFVLGLLVLEILFVIPFIGGLTTFIAYLVGLGGIVILKKTFYTRLREKKLI